MAVAKTMHGARGQLIVDGEIVGIFTNVSYGVQYDAQPIHLLGRFSPAEIVLTGQEAISMTASGFRVVGNGPHVSAKVPKLQDLLNHSDISLALYDRQSDQLIMTVVGVRPTGYSTQVSARGIQEVSVNFLGLRLEDESGQQGEDPTATTY